MEFSDTIPMSHYTGSRRPGTLGPSMTPSKPALKIIFVGVQKAAWGVRGTNQRFDRRVFLKVTSHHGNRIAILKP